MHGRRTSCALSCRAPVGRTRWSQVDNLFCSVLAITFGMCGLLVWTAMMSFNPASWMTADAILAPRLCLGGRPVPTTLMIGCEGCGSTSLLHDIRTVIPDVISSPSWEDGPGELFIDVIERMGVGGWAAAAPSHCLIGQHSATLDRAVRLAETPSEAERLSAWYLRLGPHATTATRFIMLVRNPVDRIHSIFHRYKGQELSTFNREMGVFEFANRGLNLTTVCAARHGMQIVSPRLWQLDCAAEGMDRMATRALTGGLYAAQIAAWLQVFDKWQLYVVSFGGYIAHPGKVLDDLAVFITNVPQSSYAQFDLRTAARLNIRADEQGTAPLDSSRLEAFYEPHNQQLLDLVISRRLQGELQARKPSRRHPPPLRPCFPIATRPHEHVDMHARLSRFKPLVQCGTRSCVRPQPRPEWHILTARCHACVCSDSVSLDAWDVI